MCGLLFRLRVLSMHGLNSSALHVRLCSHSFDPSKRKRKPTRCGQGRTHDKAATTLYRKETKTGDLRLVLEVLQEVLAGIALLTPALDDGASAADHLHGLAYFHATTKKGMNN
jgi:hypothetical protein